MIGRVEKIFYLANKPTKIDPDYGGNETKYVHDFSKRYMPYLCKDDKEQMLYIVSNLNLKTGWIENKKERLNYYGTDKTKYFTFTEQPQVFARIGIVSGLVYQNTEGKTYKIAWKDNSTYHPLLMADQDANILYLKGNLRLRDNKIEGVNDFQDSSFYDNIKNPEKSVATVQNAPRESVEPEPRRRKKTTVPKSDAIGGDEVKRVRLAIDDIIIDPKLQPRSKLVDRSHVDSLKEKFDLSKLISYPIEVTEGAKVISGFHRATALKELVAEGKKVYWQGEKESVPLSGKRLINAVYIPPALAKEASRESNLGVMGFTPYELAVFFEEQHLQGMSDKDIGKKFGGRKESEVKNLRSLAKLKYPAILEGLRENIFDPNMIQKLALTGSYGLPIEAEQSAWKMITDNTRQVSLESLRRFLKFISGRIGFTKTEEEEEAVLFELPEQGNNLIEFLDKIKALEKEIRADIRTYEGMLEKEKDAPSVCSVAELKLNLLANRALLQHLGFFQEMQKNHDLKLPAGMDAKIIDDLSLIVLGEKDRKTALQELSKLLEKDVEEVKATLQEKSIPPVEKAILKKEEEIILGDLQTVKRAIKKAPEVKIKPAKSYIKSAHQVELFQGLPLPTKMHNYFDSLLYKHEPQHAFGFVIPLDLNMDKEIKEKQAHEILQVVIPKLQGRRHKKDRQLIIEATAKIFKTYTPTHLLATARKSTVAYNPPQELLFDEPDTMELFRGELISHKSYLDPEELKEAQTALSMIDKKLRTLKIDPADVHAVARAWLKKIAYLQKTIPHTKGDKKRLDMLEYQFSNLLLWKAGEPISNPGALPLWSHNPKGVINTPQRVFSAAERTLHTKLVRVIGE